jgi:UDPglucose 6-dehydrogenase/GDP-mannose 6-dehydrogenase
MRVSIVGAGYVGLVTAACLAEEGIDVICVDVDPSRVEQVRSGVSPIHEPGLVELLERNAGRRLRATVDMRDAVLDTDLTLIAVGTPSTDAGIDLSNVAAATRSIGEALATKASYHVVVVKSTVVPGSTDRFVRPELEAASGKTAGRDFGVGVNPEFLTEGQAVADFRSPDRLVLGGIDARTCASLEELYAFVPPSIPRFVTGTRTAEMIKYASNALLATSISFANEIGNLCAAVGDVDVVDVMRGVHASHYLTPIASDGERVRAPLASFLDAGCGFGGSCLPKDVRALIAEGERLGQPMRMLRAVIDTNEEQPSELVGFVDRAAGGIHGRRVTVLGLAFKPDTDDTRDSPSIAVVRRLLDGGANVTVHDPVVRDLPVELSQSEVQLEPDLASALRGADVVVLVTRWDQYREVPDLLTTLEPQPPLVDGRRMLERDRVASYSGIGLG